MKLHFLGGAMEIGGSCIYVRIAGKGILLDSGIRQTASKDPLPDFRTVQEQGGLDAVIISHAHMDHIGSLPIISKAYPDVRIYMTAMTKELTRILLYDSLKIMNNKEDEIPHYSEQDVLAMLNRIYPVNFQTAFPIFDNFTLTFYPAGHIAGAACVYLVTEEGSLFYSGDFSAFSQRTIEGIRIPKLRPDVSIVETTYGNRLHANRAVEEKRLVELVRECILEKKKILIPAFALGRAQEVLLILRSAIQNQELPSVPVYIDGMIRDINIAYTRNPTYLKNALGKRILKGNEPFYTKEIQPVAPAQKREELLSGKESAIFISSSGMLTGGPSAQYARLLAPVEDACIIITGYQDEESPGRQLLKLLENEGEGTLAIQGVTVPVACQIRQVGLSAHGDKSEIMSLLERLSSRHVFLVHGNREVIDELGSELAAEDYRRNIYLPECGQEYEVSLHKKRKQLSFRPAYTMQMNREFTEADEKRLWDYWQEHYFGRAFSVSQIAYIWYGKTLAEAFPEKEEMIERNMQKIFLNSNYFSPNVHRLFLFEANSPEEVKEALAPKELTPQELEVQIQSVFTEFDYRKISYHLDRREVVLQFDYPDSQNTEAFREGSEKFTAATGWKISIHPSMNHNAASLLLTMLFEDRLTKVSYYADRKAYAVTLAEGAAGGNMAEPGGSKSDREAAASFEKITGWMLFINGKEYSEKQSVYADGTNVGAEADFFYPADMGTERVEQNLAMSCIDETFSELSHKPDKKSLKHDTEGKYLELGFISPFIGRRYQKELQMLSNQIGWRIRISDRVNQTELMKTAQRLCMENGVRPAKNPSYLPGKKMVQIKLKISEEPDVLEKIIDEFLELTGCGIEF